LRLDQTHITIRRRNALEIFDLAVHVLREHLVAISILSFVGFLPWALINYLLVGWMISEDHHSDYSILYWFSMCFLVASQAQIATMFVTKYLGDATFVGRPRVWPTFVYVIRNMGYLLFLHLFIRMLLFIMACALPLYSSEPGMIVAAFFLVPILLGGSILIRMVRPFVNEILLLEKTPIRSNDPSEVVFSKRSSLLHSSADANIFGRSMLAILFMVPVYVIFFSLLFFVESIVMLGRQEYWYIQAFCVPLAMWMTATFLCVSRFLTYIDTRIYQEGWDVELKLRAEAIKIQEKLV